jgi:FAD synthase
VEFWHWLRDQEKYAGVEPLVRQLKKDVEKTREMMAAGTT